MAKKQPQPDKKYLEAIRRLTRNVNRDFLGKVKPTSFIGDKGESTLIKVWPGTDQEWLNKVEAFQSLHRKAYGKDASKKAITENFGARVINGQLQVPTGGKWTVAKNTGARSFKPLGSQNRSWRILNEWVQTPGKYTKEALNFAYNDVRSKPVLEALGKVVPAGDVHQHHLFLLEILKPFTQNAQGGVRTPQELSVLFNTLAKKGFFSGNLDENLVWLTLAQHLESDFSVHNILQKATDIQGRGLDDEAVKWINVAIDGNVQRFPKTAETTKKLKELQKQGAVVEKVSYHLGDDFSRTYDIGAKHGFADEFLEQLRNETDINKVASYLDEYADTIDEGLTGAVKVAKELYPATGDTIRKGGPLAKKLGGPLEPAFIETLQKMKADPKDAARLGELAARNQQVINQAKQGFKSGVQQVDNLLTGQPNAFALADGGVLSQADAIATTAKPGTTARALGVVQKTGEDIVQASNLARYENVQNLKAFSRPGTTALRRVATVMPFIGAGADVWDLTERIKTARENPDNQLDQLQAYISGVSVGTTWYAEPVNFGAGVLNLGIDVGRTLLEEDKRKAAGNTLRALGTHSLHGIRDLTKTLW